MKLSIIVPVYNGEEHIRTCLESLCNQTYTDIEIIVVDDGSTDSTPAILRQYADRDHRIQILHQKNCGPYLARKKGTLTASGDYILNVDSDDWIDRDTCYRYVEVIDHFSPNLILNGLVEHKNGDEEKVFWGFHSGLYKGSERKTIYEHLLSFDTFQSNGVRQGLCNKAIERNLLVSLYQDLNLGMHMGEDSCLSFAACALAESIYVFTDSFYHVLRWNNSFTRSAYPFYFCDLNYSYLFFIQHIPDNEFSTLLKYQADKFLVAGVFKGMNENDMFDLEFRIPFYDFPKERLQGNGRLILYGAGAVGRDYYIQIQTDVFLELVSWQDRNFENLKATGLPVEEPHVAAPESYDWVLLAFLKKDMADGVRQSLVSMGYPEERLLWTKPVCTLNRYADVLERKLKG